MTVRITVAALALTACFTEASEPPRPIPAAAAIDPTLGPRPSGDTVAQVDVARYVGTWYEIATIPQGFQARCAATTATYAPIDATTVSVWNRCRLDAVDGELIEIRGSARVVDPSNARLEVDFGFARAPYWIVDLGVAPPGEPYPWAVVSNPDRSALWILARTPELPAARYDALIERLTVRGFEPARLRRTAQPVAPASDDAP